MEGESHGPWYYQQIELGFNFRMTDIQAALGLSQMKRLDEFVARRHYLAERYNNELKGLPLILPRQHIDSYSAFHLYVVRLDENRTLLTRRQVFDALRNKKIIVNVHYIPVHTQPYYQNRGFSQGDFPIVEGYYKTAISIPIYFGLEEEEQDYVIEALKEILQ
jgi:dTDP-4-amino-4,6-dideoxygalactose transaminase